MSIQCPRCGRFDCIGKASVIVEQQTFTSPVMQYGTNAQGQAVSYNQNVTSQSDLARNLTADEPRKGNGCWSALLVGFLLLYPTLGVLLSCIILGSMDGIADHMIVPLVLFLGSVLVFVAIIIISVVVSRKNTNNFNRQHAQWYAIFDRRYYCSSCGTSFQI